MSSLNFLIIDSVSSFDPSLQLGEIETLHRQLRPKLASDYAESLRLLFADGHKLFLLHDEDQFIGLALLRIQNSTRLKKLLFIEDLVIHELYRGQGYGEKLMNQMRQWALSQGCVALELNSGIDRHKAHQFYLALGFQQSSLGFHQILS